jgi:MFS family permease
LRLAPGERAGLTGLATELRENARDVARGIRAMRQSARATYAVSAIWTMRGLVGFLLLAGVVLLRTRFDLRATGASVLLASIAVGGFVGAVVLPWAAARLRSAGVAPAAFALAGVAMLALGPIPVWPALVAAVFFGGLAMMATKIAADTMVQRAIGDSFRGRAFAVYDIGYNGIFVLAALIPTVLVSTLGEVGIVILAGVAGLVVAALMAAWARRLPEAIEVRTYAGSRGDEVPREVVWDGEVLAVAEVERAWHEDRAGDRLLVFRLRLSDGRRVQVSRGPEWRLDRTLTPGTGPGAYRTGPGRGR